MNEHDNHLHQSSDEPTLQAPPSLLPQLLARLGLEETPGTSLVSQGQALLDPEWTVRANAVQALAELSDQESFDLLHFALRDTDDSVRACAVRVLGRRGDAADFSVIEQIEAALRDPAWHVRETAVYALGNLEAFASISALNEMLHDSDDAVRRAAIHVIERLQSVERKEQPENLISGTSEAPVGIWPQWIRRSVAHFVRSSHAENKKELAMLEEKQKMADQNTPAMGISIGTPEKHSTIRPIQPRRPWLRVLEQAVAVLLVLGIALSWFAISHLPRSSSGAPPVFSDTNARPLGAPAYPIQDNLSNLFKWSGDSRTFYSLHVDTQKQALEVRALDAATGHTTIYPVLDSSWIPALRHFNIDQVGHYLVALRPLGNHQATMEIWDITGQRAITTQTVPAVIAGDGVESPLVVPSNDERKLAVFSPDGTVTIWNIASGQKLVTLKGSPPYFGGIPPEIKWYNHDQNLLFFARNNFVATLEVWNTTTGTLLINQHYTSRRFLKPSVSPDGRYLALAFAAVSQHASTINSIDMLLILDAHSGQVLHRYKLTGPGETGDTITWLPDNQHLLITSLPNNNSRLLVYTLNVSTGQINLLISTPDYGFDWLTPDSQHLVVGTSPNSRSVSIWEISSGRLIASIATPGIYPSPYSFFDVNNQYLIIGEKDTFDIWDIATGKLLYKYQGFTPFSVAGNGGGNVFWSPNGKYLTMIAWKTSLIGAADGVLAIWRMP